jgi:hypothetical protein
MWRRLEARLKRLRRRRQLRRWWSGCNSHRHRRSCSCNLSQTDVSANTSEACGRQRQITSVLMSRAAHDDFAFAAGSQLERLVAVSVPRVCRARVGVDGASRTILEKLREVGGRRGGSSETHGCIDEIQAKVCRSPFGIACADLPHASGAL